MLLGLISKSTQNYKFLDLYTFYIYIYIYINGEKQVRAKGERKVGVADSVLCVWADGGGGGRGGRDYK